VLVAPRSGLWVMLANGNTNSTDKQAAKQVEGLTSAANGRVSQAKRAAAFDCGEGWSGYLGRGIQDRLPDQRLYHFHLEPVAGKRLRLADR
jgi:hypothetical protein